MKVVLDTNVLISGFLTTTGPLQYVVKLALKRHSVILSEYILEEFQAKMKTKLKMPQELVKQALDYLRRRAIIFDVLPSHKIQFTDPKDIPILSLVEATKVNYFVTGDKKLQSIKKLGPTLFLSPREAMEIL